MDQFKIEKIGKFIQTTRKQNNMTQKDLANELGVSDKLISKWETGNGMPDISLINSLCEILHISINELLSGESLPPEKYTEKAEENIMELLETDSNNKKSYKVQIILGGVILFVTVLLLALTTYDATPALVSSYFNIYSFLIIVAAEFACVLLACARTFESITFIIRKTVASVGAIVMTFKLIGLFANAPMNNILFYEIGYAILPLLYSLGIYVIAFLLENKSKIK